MLPTANKLIKCSIYKPFAKTGNDKVLDMSYKADFHLMSRGGATVADVSTASTGLNVFLTEPQYDFGTVDESDFMIEPAEYMVSEFKASEYDSALIGFGSMTVFADYYMTPYFGIDDKLLINFQLDMPVEMLPKGAWVFQYMQIYDEGAGGTAAGGKITLGCTTQVGSDVHKVTEYQGVTRMDNVTMTGTTVVNQNSGEIHAESSLRPTGNEWDYQTQESWVEGNRLQNCVIELPISKENPDDSIYTDWRGWFGARIYKSLDDTTPMQIKESKTSFYLEKPDYTQPIPSKEDLEFFEELSKYMDDEEFVSADEKGEREFLNKAVNPMELTAETAGYAGKAQQLLLASYYQVPDIDEPDQFSFFFQADLPRDAVVDGQIIYQWAKFTPVDAGSPVKPIGIACVVEVGNPDATWVMAYWDGEMDFANNGAVTWDQVNFANRDLNNQVFAVDDPEFYATKISDFDRANKIQNCEVVMALDKIDTQPELFQAYTATYGVRIYTSDTDAAPKNLGESSVTLTLEKPTYKVEAWDEDVGIPDTLETFWDTVTSFQADVDATKSHNMTIDYLAVKDFRYQDAIEFHFTLRIDAGAVATGNKVLHYVQMKQEASTDYIGAMCVTAAKPAAPTEPEVFTTVGTVANTGTAADASTPAYSAPPAQDVSGTSYRQVFDEHYYAESVGADGKEEYRCSVAVDLDKTSVTAFKAYFAGPFSGFYGARIYNADGTYSTTVHDGSFTVTFTEPTYEFGDEFEFNEAPQQLESFKNDAIVDLTVLDATRIGAKGFAKMRGDFSIVPNFDQLFWQFTFSLEMPTDMFKTGNWVQFEASYVPTDPAAGDKVFITCGVEVGKPLSAEVKEYDDTYTWGSTSATATDNHGWTKNYNLKNYNLVETINGKSKQNCATIIPLDPEEVDYVLSGLTFDSEFTVYVATTKTDPPVVVQAPVASQYTMGKPKNKDGTDKNFSTYIEPLDDVVTDIQVIVEKESTILANTVDENMPADSNIVQWVSAGFEINPLKLDAPDEFLIEFELDAPAALMTDGSRVFQYATFQKKDALEEKPITVACATQTGDEYVSEILTYKGFTSMKEDSPKVKDLAYNKQNLAEKALKKESFELIQDAEWYRTEDSWSAPGVNRIQPCRAVFSMGKKLPADDPFYGNYQFTVGARIYENDEAKTFKAVPAKVYDISVTAPETNLTAKYEEQQPETSSEELVYFDERFFFDLQQVTGNVADAGARGYQKVRGGYKLYGAADAEDRWFFNLGIELPADKFPAGSIVYQYLTYEDAADANSALTGAVGCKVEIGDTSKTSTDQWLGVTNLSSDNQDVQGQKWTKQVPEGKMREPSYRANWWDDSIFALKDSTRTIDGTAYKIQECEVEIILNKTALDGDKSFTLTTGVRVYGNNTATTFTGSPAQTFEWYRSQMTYSEDLEIPATYDPLTRFTPDAANNATLDPVDISTEFADRISALTPSGGQQVQKRERQSTANAVMSFANGYSLFKNIKESDWWWWWTALDINESLMKTGDIIYQFVTITDTPKSTSFTLGCATTVGTDGETLHYYKHNPASDASLLLSDNASHVVGKAWDAQGPTLKELPIDIDWSAGSTHVPSDKGAPTTSTTTGNKIYACNFYEELKKIGRNPNDFGKTLDIKLGARIYESTTATTFLKIPEVTAQITKPALPTYEAPVVVVDPTPTPTPGTPTGASELITAVSASIIMLIALLF